MRITHLFFRSVFKPLKSKSSNKWIVMRESATEAPNFFLTTDFINFEQLTDIQPQKRYNWMVSELVTWDKLDRTKAQGILYKPEKL